MAHQTYGAHGHGLTRKTPLQERHSRPEALRGDLSTTATTGSRRTPYRPGKAPRDPGGLQDVAPGLHLGGSAPAIRQPKSGDPQEAVLAPDPHQLPKNTPITLLCPKNLLT